ncbi:hypothetical protein GYA25_03175 [Candidatus Woesearchaeota archaeon]|nr:hypothetical protein [Candidatus Woesearchaeota archaeon]
MLKYKKAQIGYTLNWGAALILIFIVLLIFVIIALLFINHSNLVNFFEPKNTLIEFQNQHLISKSEIALSEIKEVTSMNTKDFDSYHSKIINLIKLEND